MKDTGVEYKFSPEEIEAVADLIRWSREYKGDNKQSELVAIAFNKPFFNTMNKPKKIRFQMPPELLQKTLNFLAAKPWGEVQALISELAGMEKRELEIEEITKATPKEDDKEIKK